MLVDKPHERGDGRSSSAAKKAEAVFKIAFARRSSRFSRSNSTSRRRSSLETPGQVASVDLGLLHPAAQRIPVDTQLLTDPTTRAGHRRNCSSANKSSTRRIARSRTSGGYFCSADMTHPSWDQCLHQSREGSLLSRGRHANHLYLQVVGDGDPTPSSDPTPSHRAPRPRRCSRSSPATKRRYPPAPCCGSSTTQRPSCFRRSSATPTVSTWQPSSSSGLRASQSSTKPTSSSPGLTNEPAWPTLRAHLLTLVAETGKRPLRHLLTAAAGHDL
jgi:hypothetical protein